MSLEIGAIQSTGKSSADLSVAARAAGSTYWKYVPEGAESMEEMQDRGIDFFNNLCDDCYRLCEGSDVFMNVLVVCHGGLMVSLMSSFSENYGCQYPHGSIGSVALNTGRSCFDVRFQRRYSVLEDSQSSSSPGVKKNRKDFYRKVKMVCTKLNNYDHLETLRF